MTITPASGTYTASSVSTVVIKWCSTQPFNAATRQILLRGVDVTSDFSTSDTGTQTGCTYSAQSTISSIALSQANDGINQLQGRIENTSGYLGSATNTYTYRWPGYVPSRFAVGVWHDLYAAEVPASTASAVTFTLRNDGSRPANYNLSATCTGAATGCSQSAYGAGLDTTNTGRQQTITVWYTASATPGATGRITLTAKNSNSAAPYNADMDSASTDVSVATPIPNKTGPIDDVGGGATIRRDLCLTVAAGPGAAAQCGDLRIGHALPSVTTRGMTRTPMLQYISSQGPASNLVQADVTIPTSYGALSQVTARVYNADGAIIGTGVWSGSDWGDGATMTRRIALRPAFVDTTRVQFYTLQIIFSWASGATTSASVPGEVATVSRNGPLGKGWGVGGVSFLYGDANWNLVRLAGDGSTIRYTKLAGQNLWRAVNLDHPDSMTFDGTLYHHRTSMGADEQFNWPGYHIRTKPLVGPSTWFNYTNGMLQQIIMPSGGPDSSTAVRYEFSTAGNITYATLYSGGLTRTTTIVRNSSNQVTQIIDPDGLATQFGWSGDSLVQRTDRRGYVTAFHYGPAGRLASHSLPGSTTAFALFRPAEVVGMSGSPALSLDETYSSIQHPLSLTVDITKVWPSRYGPPTRVRTADGQDTRVLYDGVWPALAFQVIAPTGLKTQAFYDSRGLEYHQSVFNSRYLDDSVAVTRTFWHPAFAKVTRIEGPSGQVTNYGYNADGTVQWTQTGNDLVTNVNYTPTGQYLSSNVPGRTELDEVQYDAVLGNPIRFKDRKGVWTATARDNLGRPVLDSAQVSPGLWTVTATQFNASGADSLQTTYAPATQYVPTAVTGAGFPVGNTTVAAQTQSVRTLYDQNGNVIEVARWGTPNPTALDTVKSWYTYNPAGWKTIEGSNASAGDQIFSYDAMGHLTQKSEGLTRLNMEYDVAGRVRRRMTTRMRYEPVYCRAMDPFGMNGSCNYYFPLTTAGTQPLIIDGDTAVFDFDAGGRMTRADNQHARIRRTYSPGGLLLTDTLRTRIVSYVDKGSAVPAVDFNQHVYGLAYSYDLSGRRSSMQMASGLCLGACGSQTYGYDPASGRLSSTTDMLGKGYYFHYTAAGQLEDLIFPYSAGTEHTTYDAEGLAASRLVPGMGVRDTMVYDVQGRIISGTSQIPQQAIGYTQTVNNWYTGLGALSAMETVPQGGTPKLEEFRYDVLGNAYQSRRHNTQLGNAFFNPLSRGSIYDLGGRLMRDTAQSAIASGVLDYDNYSFDGQGRTQYRYTRTWDADHGVNDYIQEAHYYEGTGKLAVFERHVGDLQQASNADQRGLIETYRYDALGRRILLRTLRTQTCTSPGCDSPIQRFVWDGDQLLYETRGDGSVAAENSGAIESDLPGGNSYSGATNAYGVVGYTHAGGIDRPVGLMRMSNGTLLSSSYPQTNWRGQYTLATLADGTQLQNGIAWPGKIGSAFLGATPRSDPYEWFGGLITEQVDASGLMYRRNRYYDPKSGRFTQEDPIGLAGGINAYGFANGDPVNFRDPFGLCPPDDDNKSDCQSNEDGSRKESFCPSGTKGVPPNCVDVNGKDAPGSCPNVSAQEWDLGQQSIALTRESKVEEGFAITGQGVVPLTGPGYQKTTKLIEPVTDYPRGTHTIVHSHPSGGGISQGDIKGTNDDGKRTVSAGVGTNRYGSYSRGGTPVTCNMPARP